MSTRYLRRELLAGATCAAIGLTSYEAFAQTAITTPDLTSVANFRDIAGPAASVNGVSTGASGNVETTANNGVMRTGVFYRSAALSTLSATDSATLTALGITLDIDLRTTSEVTTSPDVVPTGAQYLNINVLGVAAATASATSAAAAVNIMEAGERAFVTDPVERANIGQVLLELAHSDGADLYHCSAGKDRTGWISAILQSIAGVSSAQIMTDYLASNAYNAKTNAATLAALPAAYAAIYTPFLINQASFLDAGFDQVSLSYGSLNNYLIEGLGLTQADIYVLRAKMVYFTLLPGQAGFVGNDAAGALLLQDLQNSPLSGNYTAYNYYLQSSIDAGTLGGVQSQVGGQVYADTVSYFLRQPRWVESAIAPYAAATDLSVGQYLVWQTNLGGVQENRANNGGASSTERGGAPLFGATWRPDKNVSLYGGFGYSWGSVSSAGATALANDFLFTVGGRLALTDLDHGYFVAAQGILGAIDNRTTRNLNAGLGSPAGSSTGAMESGRFDVGYRFDSGSFFYTPQVGVRVVNVHINGLTESGSELALRVDSANQTAVNSLLGLGVSARNLDVNGWRISPDAALTWEHALNTPDVMTTAAVYDYTVKQAAAFNAHDVFTLDLGVSTVYRDKFIIRAALNGLADTQGDHGIGGKISAQYRF
jgi:protein tyrosine/serine phosphatase